MGKWIIVTYYYALLFEKYFIFYECHFFEKIGSVKMNNDNNQPDLINNNEFESTNLLTSPQPLYKSPVAVVICKCKACGQTDHQRKSSRLCPFFVAKKDQPIVGTLATEEVGPVVNLEFDIGIETTDNDPTTVLASVVDSNASTTTFFEDATKK